MDINTELDKNLSILEDFVTDSGFFFQTPVLEIEERNGKNQIAIDLVFSIKIDGYLENSDLRFLAEQTELLKDFVFEPWTHKLVVVTKVFEDDLAKNIRHFIQDLDLLKSKVEQIESQKYAS